MLQLDIYLKTNRTSSGELAQFTVHILGYKILLERGCFLLLGVAVQPQQIKYYFSNFAQFWANKNVHTPLGVFSATTDV